MEFSRQKQTKQHEELSSKGTQNNIRKTIPNDYKTYSTNFLITIQTLHKKIIIY